MPYFRLNEVAGDFGSNREKTAITYGSNFFDVPVVTLHELQVGHKRREILPTREGFGIDHDPVQLAVGLDIGVDFLGYFLEIGRFKRTLRTNDQNAFISDQIIVDHISPFQLIEGLAAR